jgi:serine/threonine-protein kinase
MGEVYRARDSKLNRLVAVKVILPAFANDAERLARFRREAQLLASLNHPNIAQIHGLEDAGEIRAIVMELVEGPTLADRIAQRALPIDEALPIARRIAEALQAAHEQGVIHRDLKPANIKVRDDGTVKVLDFGLAKALDRSATSSDTGAEVLNSPTITSPAMTARGVILGTAAYMSPEQAKGRIADKRSDVWAFGCVLFEMLTGKRAFDAEDVSDTLAAVLRGEPEWSALPSDLPYAVKALLQGCLRKDRQERVADISTALFLLDQPDIPASPAAGARKGPVWVWAVPLAAAALIAAVAAAVMVGRPTPSASLPVMRFAITLPPDQQFTGARQAVAMSPDGSRLVYAADGRLFVRSLSDIEARPIPGAELALHPVFSPDGQSVVFWSDSLLKRIAVSGGSPVTICATAPAPSGISWQDDAILFGQLGTGIVRVSANGGKPEVLVSVSADELAHGPQLLPDGNTLLFTLTRRTRATADPWQQAHIVVQSLKTGERQTLLEAATDARYVPTGHIVFAREGTLYAVSFDLGKLAVSGGAVPVIEGVRRSFVGTVGSAQFSFANSGSIAYVPGPVSGIQQSLMLFDRKGGAQALSLPAAAYSHPRVSPDGKRLAVEISDGKEAHIAIYELSGATSMRRITFGSNNRFPIWSADGRHVAFQSDRDGDLAVFWQPADGGRAERLTKPEPGTIHVPETWSPTGETFLFNAAKGSEISLWMFSLGDRTATPFSDVRSIIVPTTAAFSPDGRWVAYQRGESNQTEATTFVEPFPANGTKYQIARGGRPQWSRDGTELFLVPAPSVFKVVAITTKPTFAFGNPVDVPRRFGVADPSNPRPYDVAPDGRIIGLGMSSQTRSGAPGPAEIHLVLNWFQELNVRAPRK